MYEGMSKLFQMDWTNQSVSSWQFGQFLLGLQGFIGNTVSAWLKTKNFYLNSSHSGKYFRSL